MDQIPPGVDSRLGQVLLLGQDYGAYGEIASRLVGSQTAVAITVGSDEQSPSGQFKYDPAVANEDALCLLDAGDWVGLAVADAHYGPESSHLLIERLHQTWSRVAPSDSQHLAQMVESLSQGAPALTESECTLMVAVFDRRRGRGFGLSFGDSTFALVAPGLTTQPINRRDSRFVTPAVARSLRRGRSFDFEAQPGDMLLAYTDGIDGCHYRNPRTSVRPHHIAAIAKAAGYDPLELVRDVTAAALEGVDGNPGGQDNIVIAAAIA